MIYSYFISKMVSFTYLWILIEFIVFFGGLISFKVISESTCPAYLQGGVGSCCKLAQQCFPYVLVRSKERLVCHWAEYLQGWSSRNEVSFHVQSNTSLQQHCLVSISKVPCSLLLPELDSDIAVPRLPPACCFHRLCHEVSDSVLAK